MQTVEAAKDKERQASVQFSEHIEPQEGEWVHVSDKSTGTIGVIPAK